MTETLLPLVVCGAHMSGMSLNFQLVENGALLMGSTGTASCYRLYALPGEPPRPGLVRVNSGGRAIAVEVWQMPARSFGGFLAGIPSPLGLGTVLLADRSSSIGFICEGFAVEGAIDITDYGGWRAYMAARSK